MRQHTNVLSEYIQTLCTETDNHFVNMQKELRELENGFVEMLERIHNLENVGETSIECKKSLSLNQRRCH